MGNADEPQGHHTDYTGGVSTYGKAKAIEDCLPELVRLNQEMEGHARETTAATKQAARATKTMKWLTVLVTILTVLNLVPVAIAHWPAIQGRLLTLGAVRPASEAPPIDRKKFEGLYRAGKSVEGAVGVGVAQARFDELLQAFSAELLMGKDSASTEKEEGLVRLYGEALSAYHDSATLWAAEDPETGKITLMTEKGASLVQKYHLPTYVLPYDKDVKAFARELHTDSTVIHVSSDAVALVWMAAGERLAQADRLYWGKE